MLMKNKFYLILCVFLVVTSAKAEVFTSADGYKFEVNLYLQKDSVMLGEPIYMDFDVKNLSDVDLGVLYGGDYRNEFGRPDSFDVKVIDSKGEIVPKPKTITFGGLIGFQKSPVGQSFNFRLYLSHWATFEKIGDYKIQIEKSLVVKKYDLKNMSFDDSQEGIPVKLTALIKVVSSNFQKMGVVVDTIGRQIVEGNNTADKLVPFIKDARIIKYLALAIKKNQWLMRYLAKFNDNRALNAIVGRIKDEKQEIRRNVSVALSLSVHPKAEVYLLQMRTDKYYAIRLDVVHYLGKTKTLKSTKLLKEMMNDENEQVGNEAKRYLTERGEKLN